MPTFYLTADIGKKHRAGKAGIAGWQIQHKRAQRRIFIGFSGSSA
jgi:hypothetical protein